MLALPAIPPQVANNLVALIDIRTRAYYILFVHFRVASMPTTRKTGGAGYPPMFPAPPIPPFRYRTRIMGRYIGTTNDGEIPVNTKYEKAFLKKKERNFGPAVIPSQGHLDSARLMDEIEAKFEEYVDLPEGLACVPAAWVLFASVFRNFDYAPFLLFDSDSEGCGKTRALQILNALIYPSIRTIRQTPAVTKRLALYECAILMDELHYKLGGESKTEWKEIFDGGWQPDGNDVLTGGKYNNKDLIFDLFGPKAGAGIELRKYLDTTTISRSIIIKMEQSFRFDESKDGLEPEDITAKSLSQEPAIKSLRSKIAQWANENSHLINRKNRLAITNHLYGRARDVWRPLRLVSKICYGKEHKGIMNASERLCIRYTTPQEKKLCEIYDILREKKQMHTGELEHVLISNGWKLQTNGYGLRSLLGKEFGINATRFYNEGKRGKGYTIKQIGRAIGKLKLNKHLNNE